MSDRKATQIFQIRTIICGHCGEKLTFEKVNEIVREIELAMTIGPCSWAFKEKP